MVAQHEQGLYFFQGGLTRKVTFAHLTAGGLCIEESRVDRRSFLLDQFGVKARRLCQKSQQQGCIMGLWHGGRSAGSWIYGHLYRRSLFYTAQKGSFVEEGKINGEVFFVDVKLPFG